MEDQALVFAVTAPTFQTDVIDRSKQQPIARAEIEQGLGPGWNKGDNALSSLDHVMPAEQAMSR